MSSDEATDRLPRFVEKLLVVALVFVALVRSGLTPDEDDVGPVQGFDVETTPTTLSYNICCGWQTGHSTGCRHYQGIEHQPDAVGYVFGRNHAE